MEHISKEEVRKALIACTLNPNVQLEDIRRVFEAILNVYELDVVYAMTNKEYKYQLRYVLNCKKQGTTIIDHDDISMTMSDYDMLLNYYKEHQFYERVLPKELHGREGTMLQCAIMRDDKYYGTVGFGCLGRKEWSQEERDVIGIVCQLMLIFIGLNRLKDSRNRLETEETKLMKSNTLEFFHVDLASGKCHALKLTQNMQEWFDEWGQYEEFFQAHIQTYVNRAYAIQLEKKLRLQSLRENISVQNPNITMEYPIEFGGKFRWVRATAELAACAEGNVPRTVLLYFDDVTEDEQKSFYLKYAEDVDHKKYSVIAGIDLETEQYAVYVNNLDSNTPYPAVSNYTELMNAVVNDVIDPMYVERFCTLFDLERLKAHFSVNYETVRFDFPRVTASTTYWVRLEAALAEEGTRHEGMIILYFTDITEKKKKERELQEMSLTLEKERERALQAELRAMIDPLTGAYNRVGFEYSITQYKNESVPIGFILIDVDHFKMINDTYGHEFGDEVLSLISNRLMQSFRNEDKVFRLGGDEFALLLHGCHEDAWRSLQLKFANIHQYLRESIRKDVTVTLSAGFVQSELGYADEMYKLADEALYHTKSIGRAGLSQINDQQQIVFTWRDSELSDRRNSARKTVALGNWRLEVNNESSLTEGRLFLDETAHLIFELSNTLTPEECYQAWREHLVERHREMCVEMVAKVCAVGQAECTYHWNHPTKGEIAIQVACKGNDNGAVTEIYGYMREVKSADIVLSYDDDQFLMKALNRTFFSTYYFNLKSREYYIIKGHEKDTNAKERHYNIDSAFGMFINNYVHPDYQQRMTDFADLKTLAARLKDKEYIDCEFLSVTEFGWCQTRIIPVKWDENGNVTHALLMNATIDEAKKAELDREEATKKAMKLQLRVGELISRTSVVQTALIDKNTGLTEVWLDAVFTNPSILRNFTEMKTWGRGYVYPKDVIYYDNFFTLPGIMKELEKKKTYELSHRRMDEHGVVKTIVYHFETLRTDASKILMVIEDVSDIVPKGIGENLFIHGCTQ